MGLPKFFRRKSADAELHQELRAHIEHEIDHNVAAGLSREEASHQAYLKLGSTRRVQEEVWRWNTIGLLEDLVQDYRYSVRALRKAPGFALVALLTLALGTGATTVIFTLVNGVLLKPLPFRDPDRLVALHEKTEKSTQFGNLWAFAYPNFLDCRRESRSLTMAAVRYRGGTVTGSRQAEYVDGLQISAELFSVLGVNLLHGRAFLPEEDSPGSAPVAIIGYGLWQRAFGGQPETVGQRLTFDGVAYTIVGIVPAGFRLDENEFEIFTPIGQEKSPAMQMRDRHPGIGVIARINPGAGPEQARDELAVIGRRLAAQYPQSNEGRSFIANTLHPEVGDANVTLWLLLGAVSLVLLIGCANVANLLLARSVSREREFAVRVALGASRGRLIRQCLTESAVLGLIGGALGIVLAGIGIKPFINFWPGSLPRAEEVHLDSRVLLFAVTVALLISLLFGLAPALRIPVRSVELSLRAASRAMVSQPRRLHTVFVASQITLALVLLVSAGLLGRTILRLSAVHSGLNVQNVLVTRMALSPATLADPARTRSAWQDVLDRAHSVPGIESAAIVDTVPMREGNNQVPFWTSPALPPDNERPIALATSVTPDYLKVMGITLLKGRFFTEHDRIDSEHVVVIDDVLANQAFPGQEPVGRRLWLPAQSSPFPSTGDSPDGAVIVGVISHVRHWGLAGDDQSKVRAQFYYPFSQVADTLVHRWSTLMSLAVRTEIDPMNVVGPLRQAVRGVSGDQVLYQVRTMEQLAAASIAQQRFLLLLFAIFAGLAMLLACIGIYGVLAYLTNQRVPEFGIRMALGANARDVMKLVLQQSLGMIAVGILVGIAGAGAAVRTLAHLVPGVRAMDLSAFASMTAVLVAAALLASFAPARRASQIDPMAALRQE